MLCHFFKSPKSGLQLPLDNRKDKEREKEIERDRERDSKDKEKKLSRELPSDNLANAKVDKKLNRISSSREHSNYGGKIERSSTHSGFFYPIITEVCMIWDHETTSYR